MRKGGRIYYRELAEGERVLERGQSEIRYQYDKNVKARYARSSFGGRRAGGRGA